MKMEGKILLTLLTMVLLLEGAARLLETHFSKDVRELLDRGNLSKLVRKENDSGNFAILAIGNSLARACLHKETFESELARKGYRNPKLFFLTADGTNVNEWSASYRKYFFKSPAKPDWILWVSGPQHLLDQPPASPERLAAYHAAAFDIPLILDEWVGGFDEGARFLLARVSRLVACRDRVRPLLFYNFIPGFEGASESINSLQREQVATVGQSRGSASRFRFALETSGVSNEHMFVIAAALPFSYEIPESVEDVVREQGVTILELGAKHEWGAEAFPDGYHLSEERSVEFTRETVANLPVP